MSHEGGLVEKEGASSPQSLIPDLSLPDPTCRSSNAAFRSSPLTGALEQATWELKNFGSVIYRQSKGLMWPDVI